MTKLELGFYGRMLFLTPTKLKLGMLLGASIVNSLSQGPVTPPNVASAGNRTHAAPTLSPALKPLGHQRLAIYR